MNQYLSKIDKLLESNVPLKSLTKMNGHFLPNHGLHEVCKILLKRKIIHTENL